MMTLDNYLHWLHLFLYLTLSFINSSVTEVDEALAWLRGIEKEKTKIDLHGFYLLNTGVKVKTLTTDFKVECERTKNWQEKKRHKAEAVSPSFIAT